MSATRQDDGASVANQGQFSSRVPPNETVVPDSEHKPGLKMSANDNVPTFEAKTLPAGSAPADRTFKPNPTDEVPTAVDYNKNNDPESERQSAADTLGGATSADVHTGLGHPGQGMSSAELRHDGSTGGSKQASGGLAGVGATAPSGRQIDTNDPAYAPQRALDNENASHGPGKSTATQAEDRVPETANTVASEAPGGK